MKRNPKSRTTSTTMSAITKVPFSSLKVDTRIRRAIAEEMRYEMMTKCQAKTIPVSMRGVDVLAKAKTGTGKTLAFLIPTIDRILKIPMRNRDGVFALCISPTRELASQIAEEAKQLSAFSKTDFTQQTVYGGTNVKTDVKRFQRRFPDLLVATPGRLIDLLENHGLSRGIRSLKSLIFDEADQLLEMGFRPEIRKILGLLPPKNTRQTLLFSATMPKDVMGIARFALRDKFEHIDCVGKDTDTHKRVPQSFTLVDESNVMIELASAIQEAVEEDPKRFKIMVFFVTARLTQLYSQIFNSIRGKFRLKVLEMHSRKSQSHRQKCAKAFREGERGIMFSSDVSARGMDYPDVTRVIQIGIPSDKAQYVHRLGRTARAGKNGSGLIVLTPSEMRFLRKEASDLNITERKSSSKRNEMLRPCLQKAIGDVPYDSYARGYSAMLGYYNSNTKRCGWKDKDDLVRFANRFATDVCGFCVPPALMKKTVGKMGLRGQRGLRVQGRGGVPMQETLIPGERFSSSSDRMDIEEEDTTTCPPVVVRPPVVALKDTKKKRKVCRFFSTEQGCRFGQDCRFLHETSVVEEESKNRTKNNNNNNRRRRRRRRGGSGSRKQEN